MASALAVTTCRTVLAPAALLCCAVGTAAQTPEPMACPTVITNFMGHPWGINHAGEWWSTAWTLTTHLSQDRSQARYTANSNPITSRDGSHTWSNAKITVGCAKVVNWPFVTVLMSWQYYSGTIAPVTPPGGGDDCPPLEWEDPEEPCEPSGGGGGGGSNDPPPTDDCQTEYICIDYWNGSSWVEWWCGHAEVCM